MRRLPLLVAVSLLVVPAVAGCGEREEKIEQPVELMLDWTPNPDHAGIYAAEGRGFFDAAELDVEIRRPPDPSAPIKQVATGRVDLAISYEPQVLRARSKGAKVVSVAAIVPEPLTSVVSLPPDDVPNAAALRGKKIGVTGLDYQNAFLDTMLERAKVDPREVQRVNVGFGLQKALLGGKVNATLGGFKNVEVVQLEQQGRNPTHFTVDRAGIPPYNELVLVTSEETLERKEGAIRAFIGALARGTRLAQREPSVAAGFVREADPGLDPEFTLASTKATPFGPATGRPFGWHDPARWDRFAKFMQSSGIVDRKVDPRRAFTNDLLPGRAPE